MPVGELLGVPLSDGTWGAAQVVNGGAGSERLVALDWRGDECPTAASLAGAEPLVLDHHDWSPAILTTSHPQMEDLVRLGPSPAPVVLGEAPSHEQAAHFALQMRLQLRWNRLPRDVRDGYERARQSLRVQIPLKLGDDGPTRGVSAGATDLVIVAPGEDASAPNTLAAPAGRPRWQALDALEALTGIGYAGEDLGLVDYLAGRPLIEQLGWRSPTLAALDLGATALVSIVLEMPKLSRVTLPPDCEELTIACTGPLAVTARGRGERIRLHLRRPAGHLPELSGLERVRRLTIWWAEELDCSELGAFPALARLELIEVAHLRAADRLADLRELRHLEIGPCFDLGDVATFPIPASWPDLQRLAIDGLRKVDAVALRRRAGKDRRLELRGAKTETWLAANLHNPFRDWTDHHPAREAKKACKAYADAIKGLAARPEEAEEVLHAFVEVFNDMEARDGVDTADREEICEAFFQLAAKAAADVDRFEALLDEWRDF